VKTPRTAAVVARLSTLVTCAAVLLLPLQEPATSKIEGKKLLDRVIVGLGGDSRVRAVKSVRAKGSMRYEAQEGEASIKSETVIVYPDLFWQRQVTADCEMTIVVTPKHAFTKSTNGTYDLSPRELGHILNNILRDPIFIAQHAEEQGYEFLAGGAEKIGGIEARILDVKTPEGEVRWFIDSQTGHIIRISYTEEMERRIEDYSGWKQVQGITFITREVLTVGKEKGRPTESEAFEVNPEIDPKIFLRSGQKEQPSVSNAEGRELIAKVVQAMGGDAVVKSVNSLRTQGAVKMKTENREEENQVEISVLFPQKLCQRIKTRQGDVTVVSLPHAAFAQMETETMDLPPDEKTLLEFQPALVLIDPLRDPLFVGQHAGERDFVFTFAGSAKIRNIEARILDVSSPRTDVRWFIDPQSYRVMRATWKMARSVVEMSKDYSNWKSASGIWLPNRVEVPFPNGKVITSEFKDFEINPKIDPRVFEKPKFPSVDRPELHTLTQARTIRVRNGWGGYGPSQSSEYDLQRDAEAFRGTARFRENEGSDEEKGVDESLSIPLDIVLASLQMLAESRLEDRRYVPHFEHTDDYPSMAIEITLPGGTVRFFSESQGVDMIPWSVTVAEKTYVIPTDAPARALERLSPYLGRKGALTKPAGKEWYQSAMKKWNQRDFQGVVADLTKAIELKPDYKEAYIFRADARQLLKDYQGAIADYSRLIELVPGGRYYWERAQAKHILKDHQGAIEDFTKYIESKSKNALDTYPNALDAYRNRAAEKQDLKDYGGAIADVSKIIELIPNQKDPSAYYFRATLRSSLKDYRGAIDDMSKAIEYEPKDAAKFYVRGKWKVELKDYQGAIADYTKAIELIPRDGYYSDRGKAKDMLKDYQGAQADFKKAAEIRGKK
jgi:tetratricopeptide (TPR) repeat protein